MNWNFLLKICAWFVLFFRVWECYKLAPVFGFVRDLFWQRATDRYRPVACAGRPNRREARGGLSAAGRQNLVQLFDVVGRRRRGRDEWVVDNTCRHGISSRCHCKQRRQILLDPCVLLVLIRWRVSTGHYDPDAHSDCCTHTLETWAIQTVGWPMNRLRILQLFSVGAKNGAKLENFFPSGCVFIEIEGSQ